MMHKRSISTHKDFLTVARLLPSPDPSPLGRGRGEGAELGRRAGDEGAALPHKPRTPAIVHQLGAQLYERFVADIKHRIRTAQIKAALAANAELVLHYWEIGCDILASQKQEGWGAKVIDRLSADLQREFPTLSGYTVRNLKYMRAFAKAWPDRAIVHQLVPQLPWGHNCTSPATRRKF